METTLSAELTALQHLTTNQLRTRYAEVFGEQSSSCNRVWMVKRLAWRLQALAEGGLSERARQRAAELANDADLCLTPPRVKPDGASAERITVQPFLREAIWSDLHYTVCWQTSKRAKLTVS